MRKTNVAAVTVIMLCVSCAKEKLSTGETSAEMIGPPVAVPVEAPMEQAPAVVDFSGQLRDPNLLDRLDDGVDQAKKNPASPAIGPRPVVIRGGDSSTTVELPEPPLTKPAFPEEPEKTPPP